MLLSLSALIPNFPLIINAPNAILNVLAGAPILAENISAYSASNSDQGIMFAMITHRLSEASFTPKGSSKFSYAVSCFCAFLYILTQLVTRISTYLTLFLSTLFLFPDPETLDSAIFLPLFSKLYLDNSQSQ